MDKIEIIDYHNGFERNVTGTYDLDGNNVYEWELETYDGMTSINFKVAVGHGEIGNVNLEDEDECLQIGIEDGIEIYDEILTYVNDNG